MIVKKVWDEGRQNSNTNVRREGWFLFGLIPLYIRDLTVRPTWWR